MYAQTRNDISCILLSVPSICLPPSTRRIHGGEQSAGKRCRFGQQLAQRKHMCVEGRGEWLKAPKLRPRKRGAAKSFLSFLSFCFFDRLFFAFLWSFSDLSRATRLGKFRVRPIFQQTNRTQSCLSLAPLRQRSRLHSLISTPLHRQGCSSSVSMGSEVYVCVCSMYGRRHTEFGIVVLCSYFVKTNGEPVHQASRGTSRHLPLPARGPLAASTPNCLLAADHYSATPVFLYRVIRVCLSYQTNKPLTHPVPPTARVAVGSQKRIHTIDRDQTRSAGQVQPHRRLTPFRPRLRASTREDGAQERKRRKPLVPTSTFEQQRTRREREGGRATGAWARTQPTIIHDVQEEVVQGPVCQDRI